MQFQSLTLHSQETGRQIDRLTEGGREGRVEAEWVDKLKVETGNKDNVTDIEGDRVQHKVNTQKGEQEEEHAENSRSWVR